MSEIVLDKVKIALMFEDNYASVSHGTYVRDTACYVCWTFARAFSPREFEEHSIELIGFGFLESVTFIGLFFVWRCSIGS